MPTPSQNGAAKNEYDPRWFIWTIVFLVVTGISLVSYIVFSDNNGDVLGDVTTAHPKTATSTTKLK